MGSSLKTEQLNRKVELLKQLKNKVEEALAYDLQNNVERLSAEDFLRSSYPERISEMLSLSWKVNKNLAYAESQANYGGAQ